VHARVTSCPEGIKNAKNWLRLSVDEINVNVQPLFASEKS
jgi:hypothetical protein